MHMRQDGTMRAMQLCKGARRLRLAALPVPAPGPTQVLVRLRVCGVCRTDLHVVDSDLPNVPDGIIPGHEIVGMVAALGARVEHLAVGERVGVPWLGSPCGGCHFCLTGRENLCGRAAFTGYTLNGGYAEYALAQARFTFRLPERYDDATAAPLLCAGLIGFRSLQMVGAAHRHLRLRCGRPSDCLNRHGSGARRVRLCPTGG
ncbi:alcohol dehydrogenase [Pandoraea sputorum]|nr:alcohol dehydrogenase [Pandoraea sputorum]